MSSRVKYCLFLLLFINSCIGQTLIGNVENIEGEKLSGATVILTNTLDSLITLNLYSKDNGAFEFNEIPLGNYHLEIRFLSYSTYKTILNIKNKAVQDIGVIQMKKSTFNLNNIVITENAIVGTRRGDTVSYNITPTLAKPFDNLNTIMSKLPGLSIEDGKIFFQGEQISEILVEGKSLFENTTTVINQIDALDIQKLEVYDMQSSETIFTGVKDGKEKKVINLILTDEKKKKGSGKSKIKGGSNDYRVLGINYFKINKAFSYKLNGYYNKNLQHIFNNGINTTYGGRSSFDWKLKNSLKINGKYQYNNSSKITTAQKTTVEIFDIIQLENFDTLKFERQNKNHNINLDVNYNKDKVYEIELKNSFSFDNGLSNKDSNKTLFTNEIKDGNSTSNLATNDHRIDMDTRFNFKRNFSKKGRNIISNAQYNFKRENMRDSVKIDNQIGGNDLFIDQNQIYSKDYQSSSIDLKFNEPLLKNSNLNFYYKYHYLFEKPKRDFYDKLNGLEILNEELSSDFRKNEYTQLVGLTYKYNTDSTDLQIGLLINDVLLKGQFSKEMSTDRKFILYLPKLSYKHKISKQQKFAAHLSSRTIYPSNDQLFDFTDNTGSDRIIQGNPELLPQVRYNLNLKHTLLKLEKSTSFSNILNLSHTKDKIINEITLDDNFYRVVRPINVQENFTISYSLRFSKEIKSKKIKIISRNKVAYIEHIGVVNTKLQKLQKLSNHFYLNISNTNTDKIEIKSNIGFNLDKQIIEQEDDFNRITYKLNYSLITRFFLPKQWTLESNFKYIYLSKDVYFNQDPQYFLSFKISRVLLNDKMNVYLKANDVLNSTNGIRTKAHNNIFEQSFSNLNRNLFQVGLEYKFGKK